MTRSRVVTSSFASRPLLAAGVFLWWIAIPGLGPTPVSAQAADQIAREDPDRYRGAEACGECHVLEYEVWKRTPHATGFKTLHRKETAGKIAEKMGFRLIKRDSLCIRCHYTPTLVGDQLRALSGVSCESCHGAGRDWIDVHNDYGGPGVDHRSESAEHRQQRIAQSVAAGMRRPSLLYDVARSCYGCHLVPEEELVNVGGHGTGSGTFELVEWSQRIRHNFLQAQRGGDDGNRERSPEEQRVLYLVGRTAELEAAVRGAAGATAQGVYLKAMQRRVRVALGELREISRRAELPEVGELMKLVRQAGVDLGSDSQLLAAADRIAALGRRLATAHDGSQLAGLDPLVLGVEDSPEEGIAAADVGAGPPRGDLPAGGTEPGSVAPDATGTQGDDPAFVSPAGGAADREGAPGAARPAAERPRQPRVVGEIKRRVRPSSPHRTLGAACTNCHTPQNEWWFGDPHYASVEPFFDEEPRNLQIGRLYGLRTSEITRGNQVCMDCHATVISGRESRDVQDGVGCESCHGPAGDYIEMHKEGEKSLGESRPGYQKALAAGMVKLRDLETRAQTCTGCHYIVEPRLISSGHPAGTDFDWVEAMGKIRHWERSLQPAAEIRQAFVAALRSRGPVPDVPRADLGSASPSSPAASSRGSATPGGTASPSTSRLAGDTTTSSVDDNPVYVRPPSARPAGSTAPAAPLRWPPRRAANPAAPLDLSAFPEVDERTPIEDLLLLVKERIERLGSALQNGQPP